MKRYINPSNAELIPTCHLLALLEYHHILHVSRIRVKQQIYKQFFNVPQTVLAKFHAEVTRLGRYWVAVKKPRCWKGPSTGGCMSAVSHMACVTWRMANYLTGTHVYLVSQRFRGSFDVTELTCLRRNNKGILWVFGNNVLAIFETRPDGTENATQVSDWESSIYNLVSGQRQI